MKPEPTAQIYSFDSNFNGEAVLDDLAARIRTALQAARQARSNALDHALKAGDALNAAQELVSSGWKRWLRTNCFLSPSTALLYQQLARHRPEIEAKIEQIGELSLRAARRLVAKPTKRKPKPKSDFTVAWNQASIEELMRHFDKLGVIGFLRVISVRFRRELEGRLRKEKAEGEPEPHYQMTMVLRTALGHLKIADDPKTSRPVALSQEIAALNALRGLLRMHPDFNELSVGFREAVDPKRNPRGDQKRRRAA
jgi:hypothetical protein